MIVKGVGQFMAKRYDADGKGIEVITLGSMQNLQITLNVNVEDIFGGDGMFAIDTLVTGKTIEITATDAKFDLNALQLMLGSTLREQVEEDSLWVMGEQNVAVPDTLGTGPGVAVSSVPVAFGATLFGGGNFQVRLKDSNKLLKLKPFSATTAPEDDDFYVSVVAGSPATAKLILGAAHANKDVIYNYQRTEIVDVVDILSNEVPFPVHIVHHGSFLQKDGTYAGIETELYQCIANGSFAIDAQRAAASASTITLKVQDPERADGKIGTIKRYSSAARV